MTRWSRRAVSLAVVLLGLAGCTSGTGPGPTTSHSPKGTHVQTSISYTQAQDQAHRNAQQSLQALPAGATLRGLGAGNPVPCSDDDGAPPSTPVSIQTSYWVEGVDAADNKKYVTALVAYWRGKSWSVNADQRPGDQFVSLSSDDYGVTFQLTGDGARLSIATSTPCVAPMSAGSASSGG
jgi:hypothetical protein